MKELLSAVGISAIVSIIVSFVFDTIKYRNNLKYEKLFDEKQERYRSILVFMSVILNVDNYKHVKTQFMPEFQDEESIVQYYASELELHLKFSVLYASKKVITCLAEFIDNPSEKKYQETAMEMRNDLWRKRYGKN